MTTLDGRRGRLAVATALGMVAAAVVGMTSGPAGADPPVTCDVQDAGGDCTGNNGDNGTGSGGASSRGPLTCELIVFDDQAYALSLWPEVTTLLVNPLVAFKDCGRPNGNGRYDPWEDMSAAGTMTGGTTNLASFTRPVPWRAPAEIGRDLWAGIAATLPPPDLVVSPPQGTAAIIDQPTFVAVAEDSWPGVIGPVSECDGPVCISLTATPTLIFDPGDGADPLTCAGRGTEYDPAGPEPAVQAEGACAHPYDDHTTAGPFPGSVAIRWRVVWTSMTPDDDGVITVAPQGVPVPRQVDEVQGLVVDPQEVTG